MVIKWTSEISYDDKVVYIEYDDKVVYVFKNDFANTSS